MDEQGVKKAPHLVLLFILERPDYSPHCRASLQGAWECTRVPAGVMLFFFALNNIFAIQAQHYCEVCARIVLALSRIVTQNLWKERTIPWFRRY